MHPIPRRSLLRMAFLGLALALPGAAGAAGQDILRVSDPAGLAAALASATGGETISLAPGDYGLLTLDVRKTPAVDFARPVTLVSADPADPATLREVALRGVGNLVLDGLLFDYRFSPGDKIYKRPFNFRDCSRLTIRNSVFDGDVARGVSPEADGLGYGIGLSVGNSRNVRITNNRIRGFHRGLVVGMGRDVLVAGNELSGLRMDGMNFVATQDVRIEGNYLHGFVRSALKSDHADMIQFWTKNSEVPSTGITIRGNLLRAGDGGSTQSIFMRNEEVDQGRAGPELFYRDVLIEDNVILNGHLHGITIGAVKGAVIRRNSVLRDPAFAGGPDREKPVRIPRIRVSEDAVDVRIEDNITAALPEPKPGWRVVDNLLAQDLSRSKPGYYGVLFTVHPVATGPQAGPAGADLARHLPLRNLSGGQADRPGLGAAMMR